MANSKILASVMGKQITEADVDEFIAKILIDFEGKKFKSVAESDFSLDTSLKFVSK